MKLIRKYWWLNFHYHKHAVIFCIGAELGSTVSDDMAEVWTSVQWKIHFLLWGLTGSFPITRIKQTTWGFEGVSTNE